MKKATGAPCFTWFTVFDFRILLIGLVFLSTQVFAGKVTIKLKTNTIYRGHVASYTDSTVVLETDPFDKTLITILYSTIAEIRSGSLTRLAPVNKHDIQNFLPHEKLEARRADNNRIGDDSFKYVDSTLNAFSRYYNDALLFQEVLNIETMSEIDFNRLLLFIDTCWIEMKRIGILVNPCMNRVYTRLHSSAVDSITPRELKVLQMFREQYFEFQEAVDWDVNLCTDSVYKALQEKPENQLNGMQKRYLDQLHRQCNEMWRRLGIEYRSHWINENAMYKDKIFEHYDPPFSAGKIFLTIGGVLLIPGVILPIVGGVLVGDDGGEGVVEEVEEGFGELFGRLFLGLGIACDGAGLTLLTIGFVKKQGTDKYEKLKDEYEKYRQKRTNGISINFTARF